jgi:ferric-dicitrate binding protein FerR (iron transport regulator)
MDFSKYSSFSAIDFVMDDHFISYVIAPTLSDKEAWQVYLRENPDMLSVVEEARLVIMSLQPNHSDISTQRIQHTWESISNKIQPSIHVAPSGNKRRLAWSMVTICAVAVAIIIPGILPSTPYTYTTGYGQMATVFLPDSSQIVLNANSVVKVTEGNWMRPRTIEIDGESFFHIRKRPSFRGLRSCRVVTPHATINVTGTQFHVISRQNKAEIFLEEGGIYLSDIPGVAQLTLQAGDVVKIDREKRTVSKSTADADTYNAWRQGFLQFDQTPLSDVFNTLQDQYGYTLDIQEITIINKTFSGKVPSDTPEILLRAIAETFDISVELRKNTLIVRPVKLVR